MIYFKFQKIAPPKPMSRDFKLGPTSKTNTPKENKVKPNFKVNNAINRKSRDLFNQVNQAIKVNIPID